MNTHTIRFVAAAAWLGAVLSGPALAAAQPAPPDADAVETTIEQRWEKDAQLSACKGKGCDIDISFENGTAVLTGEVTTKALKARAERLAKVAGVTRVDNRITVEAYRSAADKTRGGVNKAVSKTGDAVNSAGEVMNDGWITTKVKSKFVGADALEGSSIDVDTKNHVVTLSGTVKTAAGRAAALRIARDTDGVKDVVDKLVVSPQ
jgi:osmotically-inducible protein OsmY